jgi:SAM-dependent methyltransferase
MSRSEGRGDDYAGTVARSTRDPAAATPAAAEPRYRNFRRYLEEGWSAEPKSIFRPVAAAARAIAPADARVLDIGCGTGEFAAWLGGEFPGWRIVGIDLFDALIDRARELVTEHQFLRSDFLALGPEHDRAYDLVVALGVISQFEDDELDRFWETAARVLRPDGAVILLGPLNEFGVDLRIRHRKWIGGIRGGWERGWSVPSRQSVEAAVRPWFASVSFADYDPDIDLEPRDDPARTWTVPWLDRPRQLTNGLKLLVNYSLVVARR